LDGKGDGGSYLDLIDFKFGSLNLCDWFKPALEFSNKLFGLGWGCPTKMPLRRTDAISRTQLDFLDRMQRGSLNGGRQKLRQGRKVMNGFAKGLAPLLQERINLEGILLGVIFILARSHQAKNAC